MSKCSKYVFLWVIFYYWWTKLVFEEPLFQVWKQKVVGGSYSRKHFGWGSLSWPHSHYFTRDNKILCTLALFWRKCTFFLARSGRFFFNSSLHLTKQLALYSFIHIFSFEDNQRRFYGVYFAILDCGYVCHVLWWISIEQRHTLLRSCQIIAFLPIVNKFGTHLADFSLVHKLSFKIFI